MSLIRLLTTTRSLSDVKNEPSPYRMSEQGLLPKFGPKKRENVARGDASPHQKENLGEGNGDRTDAGCSLKSESSRKPQENLEHGTRNAESGWLRSWWQKLLRRRPRRESREPVQAEFGLDLVRVVRNDLSEADAEAEPKKSKLKLELQRPEKTEAESVFGVTRD